MCADKTLFQCVKRQLIPFRGYTLTELVIILGLLGILGMLGGVWFKMQIPSFELNGAVRQLRSDFLKARMKAVQEGNKYHITFVDSHQYRILDDDNNNGIPDGSEKVVSRNLHSDFHGLTLQSTNNQIFHPRGTASNLATVTLSNSSGTKKVKVSITGRVTVAAS